MRVVLGDCQLVETFNLDADEPVPGIVRVDAFADVEVQDFTNAQQRGACDPHHLFEPLGSNLRLEGEETNLADHARCG